MAAIAALLAAGAAVADPLQVARDFVDAMRGGDVAAITRLHSADAVFTGGDIGGPMSGAEKAFAIAQLKRCTIGPFAREPGMTSATLLGDHTPAAVKSGHGVTVHVTYLCPDDRGGTRRSEETIVVADGLVAVLEIGRSTSVR